MKGSVWIPVLIQSSHSLTGTLSSMNGEYFWGIHFEQSLVFLYCDSFIQMLKRFALVSKKIIDFGLEF